MSQLGHFQTWAREVAKSAVPLRTDVACRARQVRKVPKAEVAALLDHLVATAEHLASMVIRAVRLAAVLLRIAQNLRHAGKRPAHL